jgi:hypothetical protein
VNKLKTLALPLIAAGALMGCGAATADEADVAGEHFATDAHLGTKAEALTYTIGSDSVRLTGSQIDFGGSLWGIHSPIGSGTLTWMVLDGYYTPHLVGTMHVEDAHGKYARMHVSHWDGGGNLISTEHSGIKTVNGDSHQSWSIDLTPINPSQIVEAHVCTELSDDGVNFPQVTCAEYIMP